MSTDLQNSMRIQQVPAGDPAAALFGTRYYFYNRTVYSTHPIVANDTTFSFFANVEPQTLRNYTTNPNMFISQRGRVLSVKAALTGPGFARLNFTMANTALADAIQLMGQQLQIEFKLDSSTEHLLLLNEILPPLPLFSEPVTVGVPVNTYQPGPGLVFPHGGSINNLMAENFVTPWTPPLCVNNNQAFQIQTSMPGGVVIPAALIGYYLVLMLKLEEVPGVGVQSPRQ